MGILDRAWVYSLQCMTGEEKGPLPRAWLGLLKGFSVFYRAGMMTRDLLFRAGLFTSRKLPRPVICVGNITAGGTGKTSFVELLSRRLRDRGVRVGIILRGYGGKQKAPTVVSDGAQLLAQPPLAGDEAYLLARKLPEIPIVMGVDRHRAGSVAFGRFTPDVLILDDGFQHLKLHRDLDIVLLDASNPFGYGHLLPRGLLREPPSALKRATLLAITASDESFDPEPLRASLRRFHPEASILLLLRRPQALLGLPGEAELGLSMLKGEKVLAFSGIGNPSSFETLLRVVGAKVIEHKIFPDHHPYRLTDLEALREALARSGARMLVTTEKDAVRLQGLPWPGETPLVFLRIGLELVEGEEALEGALREVLSQEMSLEERQ